MVPSRRTSQDQLGNVNNIAIIENTVAPRMKKATENKGAKMNEYIREFTDYKKTNSGSTKHPQNQTTSPKGGAQSQNSTGVGNQYRQKNSNKLGSYNLRYQ